MDDYIKLLKNEMNLLDDKNKGQELRKDLKIENLNKKELLKKKHLKVKSLTG